MKKNILIICLILMGSAYTQTPTNTYVTCTPRATGTPIDCGYNVIYDMEGAGRPSGVYECSSDAYAINWNNTTSPVWAGSQQVAYNADDSEVVKFAFTFRVIPSHTYKVRFHFRVYADTSHSFDAGVINYSCEDCDNPAFNFDNLTDINGYLNDGWQKVEFTHLATSENIALLMKHIPSITATNRGAFIDNVEILDVTDAVCTTTPTITYETCTPRATSTAWATNYVANDFEGVGAPSNLVDCTNEADVDIVVNFDNTDYFYHGAESLCFNTQDTKIVKYGFNYNVIPGETYQVSFHMIVPVQYDKQHIYTFKAGIVDFSCDTCDVPPFDSWTSLTDYTALLDSDWVEITFDPYVATSENLGFMFYFLGSYDATAEQGICIDYIRVDTNLPTSTPTVTNTPDITNTPTITWTPQHSYFNASERGYYQFSGMISYTPDDNQTALYLQIYKGDTLFNEIRFSEFNNTTSRTYKINDIIYLGIDEKIRFRIKQVNSDGDIVNISDISNTTTHFIIYKIKGGYR